MEDVAPGCQSALRRRAPTPRVTPSPVREGTDAMTTTNAGPPVYERRGLILAIVLVAELMVILDATIVTVALPSIQSGLGFDTQLDL